MTVRGLAAIVAICLAAPAVAGCGEDRAPALGVPRTPPPDVAVSLVSTGPARYVAPAGDDANPGTQGRPWRTITHALLAVPDGARIRLAPGVYGPVVTDRVARADAPITVAADPARPAVIRARGAETALEVRSGAYLVFDGVTVEGASGGSAANVYVSGEADHVVFRRCRIVRSARQGVFTERTTRAVHVLGCVVWGNGGGGPGNRDHGLYLEGRGHVVFGNVIGASANGFGIQLYPDARDITVANNTIVGNRGGMVVGVDDGGVALAIDIVNNVIAHNRRGGVTAYRGDGAFGPGIAVRSNLLSSNGRPAIDAGVDQEGNRRGDPRFVDPAAGDFGLRAASPARGAAVTLDAGELGLVTGPPRADIGAVGR